MLRLMPSTNIFPKADILLFQEHLKMPSVAFLETETNVRFFVSFIFNH